jgi:hypothetical protein
VVTAIASGAAESARLLAYASAAVAVLAHCRGGDFQNLALTDDEGLRVLVTCVSNSDERPFYLEVAERAAAKAVFGLGPDQKALPRTIREASPALIAQAAESVDCYWPAIALIGELLLSQGSLDVQLVRSIMRPVLFADVNRPRAPRIIQGTEDGRVVPFRKRF